MKFLSVILFSLIHFCDSEKFNFGSRCPRPNGKIGFVKVASECFNSTYQINRDDYLGFTDLGEYVLCCDPPLAHQKALEKCYEYGKNIFDCDPTVGLIIGGKNANVGEFPHAAALGKKESNQITFLCGGSLISERFILTVAHCQKSGLTFARLGYTDLSSNPSDGGGRDYAIKNFLVHSNFNPSKIINDVALIELTENVQFTRYIRPACLYYHEYKAQESSAEAIGWGITEYGGYQTNHLQKVTLSIFRNPANCANKLNKGRGNMTLTVIREQICAGGERGKDTCSGDSGGSLHVKKADNLCMYQILGITSHGLGCGLASPAVYTRVYSYIPWIQNIVWP